MADKKISALTGATTPLAGTEVLPIVQSGATVKVSIANVTAGRAVSMLSGTITDSIATPVPLTINNNNPSVAAGTRVNFQFNGSTVGYVGNQFDGGDFNNLYNASKNHIFARGATQTMLIDNANDITVSAGNLKIGTAGKGIDFSANGGDVLSQYDEGVWTPVVTASSGSITSYTSSGRYTRVGREVTAVLTFKLTNAGTASGAIIATLPFSTDAGITYIGCGRDDNLGSMLQGRVITAIPGSVYITTYANASIAVTNTEVFFTIQYFV